MDNTILQAIEAYMAAVQPRKIEAPELGRDIYCTPFTVRDREVLQRLIGAKFTESPDFETRLIALKALDESGNRIFQDADFFHLKTLPAAVIARIALPMVTYLPQSEVGES